MWLAFHDDLAEASASDPVLRESTRLVAAGSLNGQASYDLRDWQSLLGASEFSRPEVERLAFYRFKSPAEANTPAGDAIMKDCSMLNLISAGDPPVAVACSFADGQIKDRGHYLHHPKHSTALADRCKQQGIECLLLLHDDSDKERDNQAAKVVDFLIGKLTAQEK